MEFLFANSVLQVSPHSVSLDLVGLVLNIEAVRSCLSGFARQDNVVLSKWLFSNTLKLILVFFFGRLIFKSEVAGDGAHPWGRKLELEVFSHTLFDGDGHARHVEHVLLGLHQVGSHLPLLGGIVYDRNVLNHMPASRNSKL